MVIAGDLSQVDLPAGTRSGMRDALETVEGVPGIAIARFDKRDVVRHPLVARIVEAYDQRTAAEGETARRRRAAPAPDAGSTGPAAASGLTGPAAASGPTGK
jgi:phosphate starvation-inducible PhoH-like protein